MASSQNRKGFTLVEIVVTMAIFATLVGLGLIALNAARTQSRNTIRRSNLKSFQVALESFHSTHRTYPDCDEISIYEPQCADETRVPSYDSYLATGFVDPSGPEWNFNSCYSYLTDGTYRLRIRSEIPFDPSPEDSCADMANYNEVYDQL